MFLVYVELVCGGCARTVAGRFTPSAIPRKTMRKIAESQGWVYREDWYCPHCKNKTENEE